MAAQGSGAHAANRATSLATAGHRHRSDARASEALLSARDLKREPASLVYFSDAAIILFLYRRTAGAARKTRCHEGRVACGDSRTRFTARET